VIPGTAAPAGVLVVHTRTLRRFSGEDAFFLQSVANVLSAVMDRRLADRAVQKSERRKTAILLGALDAIITMDFEGRVIEFNPAAEKMFGRIESEVAGKEMAELIMPERLRDRHREGMARYLITGHGRILNRRLEMTTLRSDGSEFPVELTITQISGEGPPVFCGFARDITDRKRSEEERAGLLEREQRARAAAEAAQARAAFLAEASAALASSLDYRTTLASVVRLLVPRIADGSAVDMLDAKGRLSRVATGHSDPSRAAAAQEIANRYPPELGAPHGAGRVVATGEAQVFNDVTEEVLRATARDEEHLRLLRSLRLVSLMCVPLSSRGKTLGAITLASSESGRRFGPEELAFAQDLAGRASVAIENSRLYREAREAVRARDEFLSIASHELKTPLTTLQLQIQGLARKLKSSGEDAAFPGLASRVATSERQVERLTALINNLLDISRITAAAGRVSDPRPRDLRDGRGHGTAGLRDPGRRRARRGRGRAGGPDLPGAAGPRPRARGGHSRGLPDGLREPRRGSGSARRRNAPRARGGLRRGPRGDRPREAPRRAGRRDDKNASEGPGAAAGRRGPGDRHVVGRLRGRGRETLGRFERRCRARSGGRGDAFRRPAAPRDGRPGGFPRHDVGIARGARHPRPDGQARAPD
jgi:PAS domain S-box-containing protein